MITSLRLVNFKNFADETLKVGPFTVIIGANASGKSNIRDAFRFLHGIGRGYTLAEIIGGKYGPGGQMEWEPIRGAPNEVVRLQRSQRPRTGDFSIELEHQTEEEKILYSIQVGFNPRRRSEGFRVRGEELKTESNDIYTIGRGSSGTYRAISNDKEARQRAFVSRGQPALTQFLESDSRWSQYPHVFELATYDQLGRMRFLELLPSRMREPSILGAGMLGDFGQNLPTTLELVCADPRRKRTMMSWIAELTPMDVMDFEFPRDPSGHIHMQIVERNGRRVSSYSASDGTLRFLAILAALLSPDRGGMYFFEEIDTGIHPARLWLLLDFIERQTATGDVQVITTTHSPALLTWMSDLTFQHTSVVYRDDYWSDSVIRPIAGLYNLKELRKSTTLGELFTSNWIGEAMKFSEGEPDTDHLDDSEEEE